MARNKNTLTDVSPLSGQFKSSFSNDEQTQLAALGQTPSGLGVSQNFSYSDRAKLEIGGLVAEGLEKTGITRNNSSGFISSSVATNIDKRQPFWKTTPGGTNLSYLNNRVPDSLKKSPSEKISDSRGSVSGSDSLMFPPDLSDNAHAYIALDFYRYKRPNPFVSGSISDDGTVYLPLPEDFTQNFSVSYDPQDLGLAMAIANEAGQFVEGSDSLREIRGNLGDITIQQLRDMGVRTAQYFGQSMAAGTEGALGGLVGRTSGRIANPHPTIFFQGVDLRTFNMQWLLVPRSDTEAGIIKRVIKRIKEKALPKKAGNFLTYPQLVKPRIVNGNFGQDYKKSHISSISVNYTAAGTSAFFVDGNPVAIQLVLEFKEAELYLEEQAGGGGDSDLPPRLIRDPQFDEPTEPEPPPFLIRRPVGD